MNELPPLEPYLLRAFYDWCLDNNFTPQILVVAEEQDTKVQVPAGYVHDGKIALNISPMACGNLQMTNEFVSFSARFAGVERSIWIPVGNIIAIYARENGAHIPFELRRVPKNEKKQEDFSSLFTKV